MRGTEVVFVTGDPYERSPFSVFCREKGLDLFTIFALKDFLRVEPRLIVIDPALRGKALENFKKEVGKFSRVGTITEGQALLVHWYGR